MDTASAAWLIAKSHPHGLSQIRLLKLLWLAELRHYERTHQRLTDANWFRWNNGPYAKEPINTVKTDTTHFRFHWEDSLNGYRMGVVEALTKPNSRPSAEELRAIEDVLWAYERFSDSEILTEVYADPFFEATPVSHDLDFRKLPQFRGEIVSEEQEREILSQPVRPIDDIEELFD